LLYWKTFGGEWYFYTYGKEIFYLTNFNLPEFLFGFRKGWFIYTPLMLVSVFGFIAIYRRQRELFWPTLLPVLLSAWLLSCWWCWWFGGSFGNRAMIEFYPFMAFPLAFLLSASSPNLLKPAHRSPKLQRRRTVLVLVPGPVLVLFLVLVTFNLFQNRQFQNGLIDYDSMTFEAYKTTFLKSEVDEKTYEKFKSELRHPNYERAFETGSE
jgi:hypothetical protein